MVLGIEFFDGLSTLNYKFKLHRARTYYMCGKSALHAISMNIIYYACSLEQPQPHLMSIPLPATIQDSGT
jgi:hypothetical protein